MKKVCFTLLFYGLLFNLNGQSVGQKLKTAVESLEKDRQLESALVSIYVADESTGAIVYEHNSRFALAPASTQKLFTAAAAFDILGRSYTYKTILNIYRQGSVVPVAEAVTNDGAQSKPIGYIELTGSGDPSLGSWRFRQTKKEKLLADWTESIHAIAPQFNWKGIYVNDMPTNDLLPIPEGYIWQDIGNYYGAGTSLLNWNENQYDVVLRSGATGSPVSVISMNPVQSQVVFRNTLKAGAAGSGDNAYIFAAPYTKEAFIKGTVPPLQQAFTISGSMPDPGYTLALDLLHSLNVNTSISTSRNSSIPDSIRRSAQLLTSVTHTSPTLDSLVYWFLRKSVNLYGEALVKTIALESKQQYSLEPGLRILTEFWKSKGISEAGIQLQDGSGLSPQNRVTTKALVQVLRYSRSRDWYSAFYDALPEYNGMKMKSGSIGGSRAYAGYHTGAGGKRYVFAIIINNYTGSAGEVVKKMYKVLDVLK